MNRVTSAEFQREFGRMRSLALRQPVVITNHGRDDLVLVSVHEYNRLKRRDRQSIHAVDMSDADFALLDAVHIPDEARAFDHEVD